MSPTKPSSEELLCKWLASEMAETNLGRQCLTLLPSLLPRKRLTAYIQIEAAKVLRKTLDFILQKL